MCDNACPNKLKQLLFLTPKNASNPMYVSKEITVRLRADEFSAIRFFYKCFKEKIGAILNHDEKMHPAFAVTGFLSAVRNASTDFAAIIICSEKLIRSWYNTLSNGEFNIKVVDGDSYEDLLPNKHNNVVLASTNDLKLLENLKECVWSVLVVDELHTVANKNIIKSLKSDFRIGLTLRNFLLRPDPKVQYAIMKWANADAVGSYTMFVETMNVHKSKLCPIYPDWWYPLVSTVSGTEESQSAKLESAAVKTPRKRRYKTVNRKAKMIHYSNDSEETDIPTTSAVPSDSPSSEESNSTSATATNVNPPGSPVTKKENLEIEANPILNSIMERWSSSSTTKPEPASARESTGFDLNAICESTVDVTEKFIGHKSTLTTVGLEAHMSTPSIEDLFKAGPSHTNDDGGFAKIFS